MSTFSRTMMAVTGVIATVLVILTLIDMAGYHLLWPVIVPMGCLVEVALLLIWLAGVIAQRRKTESGRKIFTLVAALLIMLCGLLVSPVVLQYVEIVMPHKYAVIESPTGGKVAILDVVDNGFSGIEATWEMLERMDERQAYIDAQAAGVEYEPIPEGTVPSAIAVDESGEVIYDESGYFDYTLDGYDTGAYGYIYGAYPVKLGIFYSTNVESEGLIYRGTQSASKIIFEWQSDGTLILTLDSPEPGDSGKLSLHP